MGSYQRGTTITIEAWFTNGRTGAFVDPDGGSKQLQVLFNGSVILTVADVDIQKYDTGKFYYEWDTPTSLTKGLYVYEWTAKIGGKDVTESAILRIRERKNA